MTSPDCKSKLLQDNHQLDKTYFISARNKVMMIFAYNRFLISCIFCVP